MLAGCTPRALAVSLYSEPAMPDTDILSYIVFGRPLQRISTQVQDMIARSTTTAEEALSGIRTVKSYVREDWELHRYDADLRGVVAAGSIAAPVRSVHSTGKVST